MDFMVFSSFDYVLCSEVIEHLPNPDEFLEKVKSLFRIEALITTPKKDYYRQTGKFHLTEYNIFEFENLLEKHFENFQVEATEYHLYAWIKT